MGTRTINYKGVDLDLEFNYSPAQRQTLEQEGLYECFELITIKIYGTDIDATELLGGDIDNIADAMIKDIEDDFDAPD